MAAPSLFLRLLLLHHHLFSLAASLGPDAAALRSFKSAVSSDPRGALSNWNASASADPCRWNGVYCSAANAVVSLSLPRAGLLGRLPDPFPPLPSLRHLNLRGNRFSGPFPSGLVAGAPALQSVVLSGNALSGPLPAELGGLGSLLLLDVGNNSFNGSFPAALLRCRRLRSLVVSHNDFTGPLPLGFGASFPELEKLDLSFNGFSGHLPDDFGNLSSLQGTADLSHNRFSGSIPPAMGSISEMVYIDLSNNNLSGPIPQTGALQNRGPTAFLGNPGLCGPPLKNPCNTSSEPSLPNAESPANAHALLDHTDSQRGLSNGATVAIVLSDVMAIALVTLVFYCCYRKVVSSLKNTKNPGLKRNMECGKDCIWFPKVESEPLSENAEQHDLVPLDRQVKFNLDELLRAAAFVLGKSVIGIVYKVVLEDGLNLAVRRLGEGGLQRFKEFRMEVEAIGKVRHANIVSLRAYYWSAEEKLLIYDYIPNGSLSRAIHGKTGPKATTVLTWNFRLKIMKGVAKGLAFLHEFSPKKYVHGDLRPSNVLLGHNMEPYISDFGLGRLANISGASPLLQQDKKGNVRAHGNLSEASVSPLVSKRSCYQAPEALKTLKPSQKWDVYSYGVIMLELITGRSPVVLRKTLQMDLVEWVQLCIDENKPSSDVLDPFLSQEQESEDAIIAALKIALDCVQASPEGRPPMRSVVETLDRIR